MYRPGLPDIDLRWLDFNQLFLDVSSDAAKVNNDSERALSKSADVTRRVQAINDQMEGEMSDKLHELQQLQPEDVEKAQDEGA